MNRNYFSAMLGLALCAAVPAMEYKSTAGGGLRRKDDSGAGGDDEKLHKDTLVQLKRIGDELKTHAEAAQKQLKETGALTGELKKSVDEALVTQTQLAARLGEVEQRLARGNQNAPDAKADIRLTAGEMLAANDDAKKSLSSGIKQGLVLSFGMKRANLVNSQRKAFFTEDVADGILLPQRVPGIQPLLRERLFIRDLIAPGRTSQNSIEYVRQTGFTNNAAPVSEGERKPESTLAFDLMSARVTTIAHIFKASKQILDDFPGLQSLIDAELRWGLAYAEERQILFGDGTGINMHGIIPQASAYAAPGGVTVDNFTRIDQLRLALLQAELAQLPATGIVLHPTDWALIELTKTTDGAYILANPLSLLGPTLWGKPVVATQALEQGDFLTGGFANGAQLFDREDANVVIATQNEDDFVKNMITIRCEERAALTVRRPEAFVYGQFEVVSG
jgi:HK97 family phage major capsid protein